MENKVEITPRPPPAAIMTDPKRSLVRVAGQGLTSGTAPRWAPLMVSWSTLKLLQEVLLDVPPHFLLRYEQ